MKQIAYLALFLLLCSCQSAQEPVVETEAPEEPAKPEVGEMVLIPAGEFIMGSDRRMQGRAPVHAPERKVNLPAYYIDAYEVTFGQWLKFTTQSDYLPEGNWRLFYAVGKERYPVVNLTWNDAKAYAEWAGKRLPTEAEWEKAARGPEGFDYPWGDAWDPTKSNCNEFGIQNTMEVGEMDLDKSPYGVYDMMGNVQEWTGVRLKPYRGSPVPGDIVFQQRYIAARGSSYALRGDSMTLWTRSAFFAKSQYGIGFRCVKDVEEAEAESP